MRSARLVGQIVSRGAGAAPRSTLQLTLYHQQRRGFFDIVFHNKVPKGFGNFYPKNGRSGTSAGAKEAKSDAARACCQQL